MAAQGPANDLFAKQLGAKGANAQHVRDRVGVPALGEHGHRHHAADAAAELTSLANGVHDLPQKLLVGDVVASAGVATSLHNLAPEALDLVCSHATEVVVQCVTGL